MTDPSDSSTPFGRGAPYCAPPNPQLRRPHLKLPQGACDCHAHVCGPASRFAYDPERIYTPPDALVAHYSALLDSLGVSRAVLIQPSVYGTDNDAMLDAMDGMRAVGLECRAVAVVDPQVADGELKRLNAAGVRGI
ncbi:MAG TPA: amidohydrolase family protein, partial [Afifellaceae bacterium]|nr:amidohydrolase family protein [Afifellaceae bacterium]